MKINDLNPAQIKEIYQQQQQNKETVDKMKNKDDKIEISDKARQIKNIASELQKKPEIREKKVREIKEALKDGQYHVDARKIAEKILSDLEQE